MIGAGVGVLDCAGGAAEFVAGVVPDIANEGAEIRLGVWFRNWDTKG